MCPKGRSVQKGNVVTSDGRAASFVVGEAVRTGRHARLRGTRQRPVLHGRRGRYRTDLSGKLSFKKAGANTVQFRDVLSIVVEVPFAPIVERFDGVTLIAAVAENVVTRRGKPIRIERLGRPEIKNVVMANPMRDPRTRGVELRDLYNREDAFALSREYRPLYESRLDANLAFFDGLDGKTAWPLGPDGRHPLRDLLIDDFLILDLAHAFAPGSFLEIERALIANRPHESAGGRWLDDDILDELLTLLVNGGARRAVRRRRRRSHQAGQPVVSLRARAEQANRSASAGILEELNMDILKDKGAVVTGAASGIGKAIATAFVEAGASVLLCDLNAKALEAAARELGRSRDRPRDGRVGREPGRRRDALGTRCIRHRWMSSSTARALAPLRRSSS